MQDICISRADGGFILIDNSECKGGEAYVEPTPHVYQTLDALFTALEERLSKAKKKS